MKEGFESSAFFRDLIRKSGSGEGGEGGGGGGNTATPISGGGNIFNVNIQFPSSLASNIAKSLASELDFNATSMKEILESSGVLQAIFGQFFKTGEICPTFDFLAALRQGITSELSALIESKVPGLFNSLIKGGKGMGQ